MFHTHTSPRKLNGYSQQENPQSSSKLGTLTMSVRTGESFPETKLDANGTHLQTVLACLAHRLAADRGRRDWLVVVS